MADTNPKGDAAIPDHQGENGYLRAQEDKVLAQAPRIAG